MGVILADSDYRAWVEVLPDFSSFNTTVESAVVGGLAGAGTQGSAAMGGTLVAGVGKFAAPLAAAFAAIGIADVISSAVSSGVDAGLAYVQNAVSSAAALEQSVGGVEAVFKENAEQILTWGGAAADSVGLSRNAYFEFATVVGSQLKNLGIPFDEVAGKTDWLITLGADLAATYGGSTSDAVAALSSLLRGERDPIERYGVGIKQADINARLAAEGLGGLTGEARKQAEIQATLDILTGQTADAQGRFAAESETLLGAQQRLDAALADITATFGEELLPVIGDVLAFVVDELLPIWADFNEELGPKMRQSLEEAWPAIKELAEQILPLIPPALEAVIDGIEWFIETIDGNIRWVSLLIGSLSDFFALLSGDVSIDEFVANFKARLDEWWEAAGQRLADIGGMFTDLINHIVTVVSKIGWNLFKSGREIISRFIDGIRSMFGSVGTAVGDLMQVVAGFFPNSPAERGPFSGAGWVSIRDAGAAIMAQFQAGLMPVDVPLTVSTGAPGLATAAGGSRDVSFDLSETSLDKLARLISGYGRVNSRIGD